MWRRYDLAHLLHNAIVIPLCERHTTFSIKWNNYSANARLSNGSSPRCPETSRRPASTRQRYVEEFIPSGLNMCSLHELFTTDTGDLLYTTLQIVKPLTRISELCARFKSWNYRLIAFPAPIRQTTRMTQNGKLISFSAVEGRRFPSNPSGCLLPRWMWTFSVLQQRRWLV